MEYKCLVCGQNKKTIKSNQKVCKECRKEYDSILHYNYYENNKENVLENWRRKDAKNKDKRKILGIIYRMKSKEELKKRILKEMMLDENPREKLRREIKSEILHCFDNEEELDKAFDKAWKKVK